MLCQTDKTLKNEITIAQIAKQEGLDAKEISLKELKQLEPNLALNVKGAIYYKCDSHTTPHEFMEEMKTHLKSKGVVFYTNEKVEHGSWLNYIENVFSVMSRTFLKHIRVASKDELQKRILKGIDEMNASPTTPKWNFTS